MNKNIITVTSYINPDLDGVSAMYAYSEFLNKTSRVSNYCIQGIPKKEVEIVCNMFNIKINPAQHIEKNSKIILLDTNDADSISEDIKLENIIEIVDHHDKSDNINKFINAKMQIELIGATATLIAQKFYNESIPISRESAILLYYGITSNSINFKADITSKKDIEMASWLMKQYKDEITKEKTKEIFIQKADIKGSLREEMEADIRMVIGKKYVTIAQLELVEVEDFISQNKSEIELILKGIKSKKELDYIFLNCIDTLEGYNILLTIDSESEKLLTKILDVTFKNGSAKTDRLVMRKQITRLIKEKGA